MITIIESSLPTVPDPGMFRAGEARWREGAENSGDPALARFAKEALADPAAGPLLRAIFAHSPFLTEQAATELAFVRKAIEDGPDAAFQALLMALDEETQGIAPTSEIMAALRRAKRRTSLVAGMADIAGAWPLESVTGALTRIADKTLNHAIAHLLTTEPFANLPGGGGGFIVLGMGKLGAHELNYSSDIDLIVFYDDARLGGVDAGELRTNFVRLTRALVRIMEERTGDGYVFRTDLRLRPDPASMPLAISLSAAEIYYGSLGQNWERAAMIKARQVAGDPAAGDSLFSFLRPWIWRRNLDFAALEDIHSIKRQIDHHKLKPVGADLLGHDVKLGRGGIREIEFYAQTQQLIFGGREPALRTPATCDALRALAAARRIEEGAAQELIAAYGFFRKVEHRLQMVDDQQTHSLPKTPQVMERIAAFVGFRDTASFTAELSAHLARVQEHFSGLFAKSPSLSGPGSLVFTGVEDDPETIKTLEGLGFVNASNVAAAIRGWHHGRYRAMRSERARELMTELMPALLAAFAATPEPDAAFFRFDTFLGALPAGVTLLALFAENRRFLALFGRIMGMAPALS